MRAMRQIIDTWCMIEKFNVRGYVDTNNAVYIPEAEYDRLLETVKSKKYLKNLTQ